MSHPAPLRIKLVPPNIKRTAKIFGVTKQQQKIISDLIEAAGGRRTAKSGPARSGASRVRPARRKNMAV